MTTEQSRIDDVEMQASDHEAGVAFAERGKEIWELAQYRTYAELHLRNLHQMQTQLFYVEEEVHSWDISRVNRNGIEVPYPINWYDLGEPPDDPEARKRYELAKSIPILLEQHRRAMCETSALLKLSVPSQSDLNYLQRLLATKPFRVPELSVMRRVYGATENAMAQAPDLASLLDRPQGDAFSAWFASKVPRWLYRRGLGCLGNTQRLPGETVFTDEALMRVTKGMSAILAALLPILEMVCLSLVESFAVKMVVAGCLAVTCSICFCLFSNSSHAEIFVFSATLSAVAVVFVTKQGENTH